MKIDITTPPPADIFRDRVKYTWIFIFFISLAACGMLLIIYGIVSDAPSSETLETAALALLVGPAIFLTYFGGKLRAYKKLGPHEKEELKSLALKFPEILTYCALVAEEGREPIFAEYEAFKDWAENADFKQEQQ